MDSGFEALPPRGGRKRKLMNLGVVSDAPLLPVTTRPAHSYSVHAEPEIIAAEPPAIYDSGLFETAERLEDTQPGGVEGSGGMGKWEYLDHTADVQVHTCEISNDFFVLSHFSSLTNAA